MDNTLHITGGDSAGASLAKAGLSGKVFVWHGISYDGPRLKCKPPVQRNCEA